MNTKTVITRALRDPTTLEANVQTYVEILLVHGPPPNLVTFAFQDWNNVVHRWMLDRGLGEDAIERKDIVDHYIVWLAWQDVGRREAMVDGFVTTLLEEDERRASE